MFLRRLSQSVVKLMTSEGMIELAVLVMGGARVSVTSLRRCELAVAVR